MLSDARERERERERDDALPSFLTDLPLCLSYRLLGWPNPASLLLICH